MLPRRGSTAPWRVLLLLFLLMDPQLSQQAQAVGILRPRPGTAAHFPSPAPPTLTGRVIHDFKSFLQEVTLDAAVSFLQQDDVKLPPGSPPGSGDETEDPPRMATEEDDAADFTGGDNPEETIWEKHSTMLSFVISLIMSFFLTLCEGIPHLHSVAMAHSIVKRWSGLNGNNIKHILSKFFSFYFLNCAIINYVIRRWPDLTDPLEDNEGKERMYTAAVLFFPLITVFSSTFAVARPAQYKMYFSMFGLLTTLFYIIAIRNYHLEADKNELTISTKDSSDEPKYPPLRAYQIRPEDEEDDHRERLCEAITTLLDADMVGNSMYETLLADGHCDVIDSMMEQYKNELGNMACHRYDEDEMDVCINHVQKEGPVDKMMIPMLRYLFWDRSDYASDSLEKLEEMAHDFNNGKSFEDIMKDEALDTDSLLQLSEGAAQDASVRDQRAQSLKSSPVISRNSDLYKENVTLDSSLHQDAHGGPEESDWRPMSKPDGYRFHNPIYQREFLEHNIHTGQVRAKSAAQTGYKGTQFAHPRSGTTTNMDITHGPDWDPHGYAIKKAMVKFDDSHDKNNRPGLTNLHNYNFRDGRTAAMHGQIEIENVLEKLKVACKAYPEPLMQCQKQSRCELWGNVRDPECKKYVALMCISDSVMEDWMPSDLENIRFRKKQESNDRGVVITMGRGYSKEYQKMTSTSNIVLFVCLALFIHFQAITFGEKPMCGPLMIKLSANSAIYADQAIINPKPHCNEVVLTNELDSNGHLKLAGSNCNTSIRFPPNGQYGDDDIRSEKSNYMAFRCPTKNGTYHDQVIGTLCKMICFGSLKASKTTRCMDGGVFGPVWSHLVLGAEYYDGSKGWIESYIHKNIKNKGGFFLDSHDSGLFSDIQCDIPVSSYSGYSHAHHAASALVQTGQAAALPRLDDTQAMVQREARPVPAALLPTVFTNASDNALIARAELMEAGNGRAAAQQPGPEQAAAAGDDDDALVPAMHAQSAEELVQEYAKWKKSSLQPLS